MKILILLSIFLLLSGCGIDKGQCVELTDNSGRTGLYIEFGHSRHAVRMDDTGNVQRFLFAGEFIEADQSNCNSN